MHIIITGATNAPSWVVLQELVQQAIAQEGILTRIARTDRNPNYRALGDYTVTFTPDKGDDVTVLLSVRG